MGFYLPFSHWKNILSNLKISWFSFFSAVQWTMNLSVKNSIAFHFQLCRSFIWQRQPHFRRNYFEVFSPHYPWLQSIRRPVLAKVSKCMEKVKFSSFYSLNIFKCTRFQINGLKQLSFPYDSFSHAFLISHLILLCKCFQYISYESMLVHMPTK
jgi:hypothetical protein